MCVSHHVCIVYTVVKKQILYSQTRTNFKQRTHTHWFCTSNCYYWHWAGSKARRNKGTWKKNGTSPRRQTRTKNNNSILIIIYIWKYMCLLLKCGTYIYFEHIFFMHSSIIQEFFLFEKFPFVMLPSLCRCFSAIFTFNGTTVCVHFVRSKWNLANLYRNTWNWSHAHLDLCL